MRRYAFIKDDLPELAGHTMVVIVETPDGSTEGVVIDACACQGEAGVKAYLDDWLGPHHASAWKPN